MRASRLVGLFVSGDGRGGEHPLELSLGKKSGTDQCRGEEYDDGDDCDGNNTKGSNEVVRCDHRRHSNHIHYIINLFSTYSATTQRRLSPASMK